MHEIYTHPGRTPLMEFGNGIRYDGNPKIARDRLSPPMVPSATRRRGWCRFARSPGLASTGAAGPFSGLRVGPVRQLVGGDRLGCDHSPATEPPDHGVEDRRQEEAEQGYPDH